MKQPEEYLDKDLWRIFLQGDRNALEILYKRHYNLLLNWGLKFSGDKELVQDCIQDLFVKLYTTDGLSETEYVQSYLLKALKNILFNKLAKNEMFVYGEESFSLSVEDSVLENLFLKNDQDLLLSKRLLDVFSRLSRKQKQIIYLRYVKELSYKEISDLLDIKEQSAMNLSFRTLSKLRECVLRVKFIFFSL